MPEWICASTFNGRNAPQPAQTRSDQTDQGGRFRFVPDSAGAPVLAGYASRARRQSDRIHHALDRVLDAHIHADHADRDTAAQVERVELAVAPAADVRVVRVLLRLPAFHHLHLARPVLRPAWHAEGHCQAAVHHRRLHSLSAADPAGRDLDQCDGEAAGRAPLATATPVRLRHRYAWRAALLVAGEKRYHRAID